MREDIQAYAVERQVPYLLHFTRAANLPSILQHGLVPRSTIEDGTVCGIVNDMDRNDRRKNANCLSISFPNYKMFFRYRTDDESVEWPVLVIHPAVLWRFDCLYCHTNAANATISGSPDATLAELASFQKMFEASACEARPNYLKAWDPTDVQAEVLVRGVIPPQAIYSVVFPSHPCLQQYSEIVGERQKLVNDRRGLYGKREYFRRWGNGR